MGKMRHFSCGSGEPVRCDVCGQLRSADGFCHHRRCFGYHVLILVTEGTLYITAAGKPFAVSAGEYIFLRAGEEHYGHRPSEGRLTYFWVHFQAEQAFVTEEGGLYCLTEYGPVPEPEETVREIQRMLTLSMEDTAAARRMLDFACSLLLLELTCREPRQDTEHDSGYPAVVNGALQWIRSRCGSPFTVAAMAKELGYRPDYLSAVFKRHTGVSIIRYANTLRIRMAKNLLANCDLSVQEVACSCGFGDEKYFMKLFRQLEDVTPTQYRRMVRQRMVK